MLPSKFTVTSAAFWSFQLPTSVANQLTTKALTKASAYSTYFITKINQLMEHSIPTRVFNM